MPTVEAALLFVGGCFVIAASVFVLVLAAVYLFRAATAAASARINLVEARERENPPEEQDDDERPSIVGTPNIPTADEMIQARLWEDIEKRGATTDDLAGVPQDEMMGGGSYARVPPE